MLAWLQYEYALRRLQNEKHTADAHYEKEQAVLRAEKAAAEKMQRSDEHQIYEAQRIHDQIAGLQTSFPREEAERCLLPIPAFDTSETAHGNFLRPARIIS